MTELLKEEGICGVFKVWFWYNKRKILSVW